MPFDLDTRRDFYCFLGLVALASVITTTALILLEGSPDAKGQKKRGDMQPRKAATAKERLTTPNASNITTPPPEAAIKQVGPPRVPSTSRREQVAIKRNVGNTRWSFPQSRALIGFAPQPPATQSCWRVRCSINLAPWDGRRYPIRNPKDGKTYSNWIVDLEIVSLDPSLRIGGFPSNKDGCIDAPLEGYTIPQFYKFLRQSGWYECALRPRSSDKRKTLDNRARVRLLSRHLEKHGLYVVHLRDLPKVDKSDVEHWVWLLPSAGEMKCFILPQRSRGPKPPPERTTKHDRKNIQPEPEDADGMKSEADIGDEAVACTGPTQAESHTD